MGDITRHFEVILSSFSSYKYNDRFVHIRWCTCEGLPHNFKPRAFETVLKKCRGKLDCLIREMLFIRVRKPELNTKSDSIRAKRPFIT